MEYSLSNAAKAVGIAKSTLSVAIKEGKISKRVDDKGRFWLDASELARVYPDAFGKTVAKQQIERARTPEKTSENIDLLVEVATLRERTAQLTARLENAEQDKAELIGQLRAIRLLVDHRTGEAAPRAQGWFRKWLGGAGRRNLPDGQETPSTAA